MSMQLATIDGIKLENRISSNGRNLGQRMAFNRQGTPAQIRQTLKDSGMKGNALSSAVRDIVKQGKDMAWVQFHALTQMAQNGDFIPTYGDLNPKSDKIKLELAKPSEEKPKKQKALKPSDEGKQLALAALLATGLDKATAEEALRKAGVL